ncbi:MAG: aminopeptidase P family protein [Candidatus Acididesulfobacter guangdongensis]|uniref:Aminopeptidase P family protein n=1 Tax=Acididesulfobacter guangdongensis TaxID=2597225 RepID=A0A519BEI4_ACIG2|nr:MAG: aminopeptidase P family protein [Candidatus Acididesulfobacter guangdongensis]
MRVKTVHEEKTKGICNLINSRKAEGILIKHSSNVFYIAGYSGEECYLFVSKNGIVNLYVDGRYYERAAIETENKNINVKCFKELYKDVALNLQTEFKLKSGDIILFESAYFTYEEYFGFNSELKWLSFIPARDILLKLRCLKTAEEIKNIKQAIYIAEKSMAAAIKNIAEDFSSENKISELDIANQYRINLLNMGSSENVAFETIVLKAERSAMPHGIPMSNNIINDGKNNILLCDFGAKYSHYNSDETVTLFYGTPDIKFTDIYDIVYSAQQLAISAIKPGLRFCDLDKIARDYIDKKGYGKYFTHSLGHGVGLDIHEYPFISFRNEDIIEEGMVFTVEPGVYIEGFGGVRIEDMCLVTKNGAEILTTITKDGIKNII